MDRREKQGQVAPGQEPDPGGPDVIASRLKIARSAGFRVKTLLTPPGVSDLADHAAGQAIEA